MDILTGNLKRIYFRYLAASFGSTLITSIYAIVDMAAVGQYHGPSGSAALAVIAPLWNIIYSFGLLAGIGGSVLYSTARGGAQSSSRSPNEYFTSAVLFCGALALFAWLLFFFALEPLLRFFGADDALLPLALRYLQPIKFTVPCFTFGQLMAAFLRNDGDPALATAAVLGGGVFNMFGDWFFVFVLDLGIFGAGLATALGSVLSLSLMLLHFLRRKNTLRLVRPTAFLRQVKLIAANGFSTGIIDLAMGVLTLLFNRQIMRYLGRDALSVYAIIVNISTFVQCCAYSVGQASQPIFSLHFGAKKTARIRTCLKYALATAAAFGLFWTGLSLAIPTGYVRLFMAPTQAVLDIAPAIIRPYCLSFLFLPINVFSTYYFQALMQPRLSFLLSIARGVFISGGLILLLPQIAGPDSVWFSMLITEAAVAAVAVFQMVKRTKALN